MKELRAALAKAGISLPSLGLDPVSLAREAPCPLIELGRCSVETARRIAAAVLR
ncbi:Secreted protein OS=Streptomyces pilosus OX=28893 GN=GCM10010280_06980 PE=4 SV=1 [Streptomyces pilosus]